MESKETKKDVNVNVPDTPSEVSERKLTQKEILEHEAYVKRQRKQNEENLKDFELQVRYDTLQSETIVQRERAMRAFLATEELLPAYLKAVENKKARDEAAQAKPLIQPVTNPIIETI